MLKVYILNTRATIIILKETGISNKPRVEIKWNGNDKWNEIVIPNKAIKNGKRKHRTVWDKQKIRWLIQIQPYNIITLSVNDLNTVQAEIIRLDKKARPTNCILSTRNPLQIWTHRLKELKKIYHDNTNIKKTGLPVLISNKIGFKSRNITSDTERYFLLIEQTHQKNIIILNVFEPNNGASKYVKQKLTEKKG